MVLRMTRPTRRSDSRNHQFQERIPTRLLSAMQGREFLLNLPDEAGTAQTPVVVRVTKHGFIKFSLRTANDNLAKLRTSAAKAQIGKLVAAIEAGPKSLTFREAVALSKEVYQLFVERFQDNPGSPDMWAAVKGFNRAVNEGRIATAPILMPETVADHIRSSEEAFGSSLTEGINAFPAGAADKAVALEARFGRLGRRVLAKHQLHIDQKSWGMLLIEVERASTDAFHQLKRNATGDYSPDPRATRFPDITAGSARKSSVTFQSLFDAWADLKYRRQSSIDRFRIPFLRQFPLFIKQQHGHEDPARVTKADVVAWRDHLLQAGSSPSTVRGASIAALNAVFGKAAKDGVLNTNPAADVTVERQRQTITRSKGFSDEEAKAILLAARAYQNPPRHSVKAGAFIRWSPFIGAYTGMRIGEIAQLRKQDITEHATEGWILTITPEAGATKSGKYRHVPIHPALIEEGFLEWVKAAPAGHLFVDFSEQEKRFRRRIEDRRDKMGGFVRQTVKITDKRIKPNHAWRHRFITIARSVGVSEEKRNFIVGHETGSIGAQYGDPAGLRVEIEKIPYVFLVP